jgi:hypothetical protein
MAILQIRHILRQPTPPSLTSQNHSIPKTKQKTNALNSADRNSNEPNCAEPYTDNGQAQHQFPLPSGEGLGVGRRGGSIAASVPPSSPPHPVDAALAASTTLPVKGRVQRAIQLARMTSLNEVAPSCGKRRRSRAQMPIVTPAPHWRQKPHLTQSTDHEDGADEKH